MKFFEKIIRSYKNKYNLLTIFRFFAIVVISVLLVFNVFYAVFVQTEENITELFIFSLSLRIFVALLILYLVLQCNRALIDKFKAARLLDEYNRDKNDTYQNALELYYDDEQKQSEHILPLIFRQADKQAKTQKIEPDKQKLKRLFLPMTIVVVFSALLWLVNPIQFSNASNFFKSGRMPTPEYKEYIELVPGDVQILRGSDVQIEVVEPDTHLDHTLFYKTDEVWREAPMISHQKTFNNLDFSFDYFVSNPHVVSDTFSVEVFEIPTVRDITLHYRYPEYTGRKPYTEQNSNGHIRALRHTEVKLNIEANNPIEIARIVFEDGSFKQMERLGRAEFETSFKIETSGSYHINLVDILGNESRKITRSISVISDQPPEIEITEPGRDTLLTKNMLLPLEITASDDFGLKDLKLNYMINAANQKTIPLREVIRENVINVEHELDLRRENMIPGDRVTYWAEVTDNSPEGQTSESRRYVARFPSMEEIYREVEQREEAKSRTLQSVLDQSQEMQREFEQKRFEMMRKEEYDWQDREELEQFLSKQEDLSENIERVVEEYEDMIKQLDENRALPAETLEKMQQIKELMEEIVNDEMYDIMQELRDKMEDMKPDDIRKAMDDFKFSMEEFSEKLDQTLKLLEDIKKEQALQKSLQLAKEMEDMQNELMDRSSAADADGEQLADEQQSIADKLDSLQEQLDSTSQLFDPEKDDALSEAMEALMEQMQQDDLQSDMQQSMENLKNMQMEQAQQNQQQASQKMQQMVQQLQDMTDMMASASQMEMGDIIRKTIHRLLILSENHKQAAGRFVRDPYVIIDDLIATHESVQIALSELYSTPMIILVLGPKFIYDANFTTNAYRELFDNINEPRTTQIRNKLDDIQKGLNLMVYDLIIAENNMQSGGGGGMQSFMQSLQEMSEEQMMMNMLTQELMQKMSESGRPSNEMRQQMQRLAQDEQRLADNLKRMLQTDQEAQKHASTINQLVEELESISRDLRRNRVDDSLIERQERILSRLLDAQKSIHKREFTEERRGEHGEEQLWDTPEEILQQFDKMRQRALLEDDYESYSREYQELIRMYLRLLNERRLRE
jgi:hypothetical protein